MHESTELVCSALSVGVSSYYERRKRQRLISAKRRILRARILCLFDKSRQSARTRTIVDMLRDEGIVMGRFKVGRLMKEQGLMSKQPSKHAYKNVQVDRQFNVEQPNKAWCGDIIYIWAGSAWHYAAVVIDLHTRQVIGWSMSHRLDAELAARALDMAYGLRGKPTSVMFHSDLGSQYGARKFRQRL